MLLVVIITPFVLLLLVYKGRPCKPQQHRKGVIMIVAIDNVFALEVLNE